MAPVSKALNNKYSALGANKGISMRKHMSMVFKPKPLGKYIIKATLIEIFKNQTK